MVTVPTSAAAVCPSARQYVASKFDGRLQRPSYLECRLSTQDMDIVYRSAQLVIPVLQIVEKHEWTSVSVVVACRKKLMMATDKSCKTIDDGERTLIARVDKSCVRVHFIVNDDKCCSV